MAARALPHNFQSTKMAFLSEGSSSGEASIPQEQPERQHRTTSMLTNVQSRCQSQEEAAGEAISSMCPSDSSETSGETVMMGNQTDPSTTAPVSFWRVRPSSEASHEQQPAPHQIRAAMEIRMARNLRDSTEKRIGSRIGTSDLNASSSAALSPPTRLLDFNKPSRQRGKDEAQVGAFREAWRGPFGFPSALTQMSLRGYAGSEDEDDADRVRSWRGLLPSERRAKQEDDLDSTCTNTNTNTDLESSLTIAQEVDQNKEKRIQVQEATEYDPSKIPMSPLANKSRTVKLLLCLLLLGVATVAITLGVSKNQRNRHDHPSEPVDAPSDTSLSNYQKRWIAIDEELEGIFGADSTSSSTFLQARDWLKHEDPMQLVPEDSNFVQRFTLALFYFQTSGDEGEDGWFSCGKARPELDETDTCGFYLLTHHIPVLDYEVTIHNRWLSSTHECIWAGVTCNASNETSEIRLGEFKLILICCAPRQMIVLRSFQTSQDLVCSC